MGRLTSIKVRTAKPGLGSNGKPTKAILQDGDGLFLLVKPSGARFWMLRVQAGGKRRDIGLGAADVDGAGRDAFGDHNPLAAISLMLRKSLTLAEARECKNAPDDDPTKYFSTCYIDCIKTGFQGVTFRA